MPLTSRLRSITRLSTHKIDIAYGYAFGDGADAQQIKAALRQADQRMYDQKAGEGR